MAGNPSTTPTATELAIYRGMRAVARASALRVQLLPESPVLPELVLTAEAPPPDPLEAPDATAGAIILPRVESTAWTVHRVERQVAAARADLDGAVVALRTAGGTQAHAAVATLLAVSSVLLELGREVNTGRARLVDHVVPHDGNVAQVAFWLYQDASRRTEIIELNRIANPLLVRAGTVLQVYER